MPRIIIFLKRVFWYGRSTRIKLWSTETIGYSDGYYECKHEQIAADREYIKSWNKQPPKTREAERLWKQKREEIEKKYFGPKWIKA